MGNNNRLVFIAVVVIIVAIASYQLSLREIQPEEVWGPRMRPRMGHMYPDRPLPGDLEIFYTAKTVISSVNTVLLLFLLAIYFELYGQVKSEFTLGLIIYNLALLLYALTSNPLLHQGLGFAGFGLGPFAMLPDLFTLIASGILLYLSQK
jgi:hypothetical protein